MRDEMRDRTYFGEDTVVIYVIDRRPERYVVYSSKGGVYRWWEYPPTKEGYAEAVATAKAVVEGRPFPPPIEEKAYETYENR